MDGFVSAFKSARSPEREDTSHRVVYNDVISTPHENRGINANKVKASAFKFNKSVNLNGRVIWQ